MEEDDEYSESPKPPEFQEHDIIEITSKAIFNGKHETQCINGVWEQTCKFIESNMFLKRAVRIRDLGLFTFYESALTTSAAQSLWTHRPLFLMDKVFCEAYDLKCNRIPPSTKTVTVFPNYTAIATLAPSSRFDAEEIIGGIVKAVRRLCAMRENFTLDFPHLGKLIVKDRIVYMRFSWKFIYKLHQNVINPIAIARDFHPSDMENSYRKDSDSSEAF